MSEERDPMDVAAEEADQVLANWKTSQLPWSGYLDSLQREAEEAGRRHLLAMRLQATFLNRDGSFQQPILPDDIREPRKPRAKRRVMMHVDDAGRFRCACGRTNEVPIGTADSARSRGIPCPVCNPTEVQP